MSVIDCIVENMKHILRVYTINRHDKNFSPSSVVLIVDNFDECQLDTYNKHREILENIINIDEYMK
jgi:hypothetical protein